MKKILTGIAAAIVAITASAQNVATQTNLNKATYKGKIGLTHVRNASDAQLSAVGKHISSIAMPTKAQTAQMLKKAVANTPAKAKQDKAATTRSYMAAANYASSDTLFHESWEGWDGQTFAWVPSSWTRFENFDKSVYISEADGMCPTWMVFETDGYYMPYATDGRRVLMCMFGTEVLGADSTTVIAPAPEQNEWIVSPTVSAIQATNFITFDLAYSPLYSHLFVENNEPIIDMNRLAYDVEVLVTTSTRSASNNEANYTKVFKLSDVVDEMMSGADLKDSTTLALLMNMRWQHFKLPLKDFAGKNIRVAFRYKGSKAGTVLLDAVRISDMLPVAMFDRPEGSFYMGFSDEARLNYQKNVLMPAYTETQWTNYSNLDADTFLWSWKEGEETSTANDYDLILPARKPGGMEWPTLQASADTRSDVFSGGADVIVNSMTIHSDHGTAKIGGNALLSYNDGTSFNFALGNFDPTKLYWLGEISNTGNAYAFGTGSGAFWAGMTNYKYNAVNGIANVYDTPAAPYVFNNVTLPLGNFFNMGAPIVCTVYKAKDLGFGALEVTDEVLGQASVTEGAPISGGYILNFDFPNVMVIDHPIAISITGFDNPNLLDLAPLSQAKNHDSNRGYSFVLLKNQTSGGIWWCEIASALASVEGTGNMEISHCIGMNAVFPYMKSLDGDVVEALTTGETKTLDIDSYWYPEKKDAQDLMNGWTVECSDSWISTEVIIDEEAHKSLLKVTAEALPSGVEGRTATVTIKATGCQEVITIKQGETSGIQGVTIDGFTTATGTYNIAGQRVNSNNAKNGIFIQNRGGKLVKTVIK